MRVLVCGGRDYKDKDVLFKYMDTLHNERKISLIINGGASGADTLAAIWARPKREVAVKTYFAQWEIEGRAAGFIRNRRMLDEGKPNLVVAFPGGQGTRNMIRLAKEYGIEVLRPLSQKEPKK